MEQYFLMATSEHSSYEGKKYELVRLGTFSKWPLSACQYSTKLSRAGFFYEGNGDEVICYVCGVKKSSWLESDDPVMVHRQLSPDCAFFTAKSNNIAIQRDLSGEDSSIIQRLENLEVGDYSASGSHGNITDFNSTIRGWSKDEKQVFPKSKSADQIVTRKFSDRRHLGEDNDSLENLLPRSTSFPSSSRDISDQRTPDRGSQPDSAPSNRSDGSFRAENIASTASTNRKNVVEKPGEESGSINIGFRTYDLSKLRYEKNRLETFKRWSRHIKVSPQDLAKAGFFFTGIADRVMCVFCKGALRNWDEGDVPIFEHRKHFPKCRLVLGVEVGNVPMASVPKTQEQIRKEQLLRDLASGIDATKLKNLGIITEKPKHPRYSIYSERLSSFKGWPTSKNQTPEKLAEAGFFYAGFGDNVKCFYCNGGLRNWEPGDEPWIEHAKWFEKCPFIKQVKGGAFILQVQAEKNKALMMRDANQPNPSESPSSPSTGQQRKNRLQSDLLGLQRVEEREIRARMDSAMVKVVEAMGFSHDVIAKVIRKKLVDDGDDFTSATTLLEAVFSFQESQPENVSDDVPECNGNQAVSLPPSIAETPAKQYLELGNEKEPDGLKNATSKPSEIKENTDIKDGDAEQQTKNEETKKSVDDLEKENIDLKEQRLCKICMVDDSSIVFLPCGHLVACAACSPALNICPICREPIKGIVRTFIA